MHEKPKSKSLFRTLLLPLLSVLAAEAALLLLSIPFTGVSTRLDQKYRDTLSQQVSNRASYLENYMVHNWSNLSVLASDITSAVQDRLADGRLSLEELCTSGSGCSALLLDISDELISTLYARQVNGIYVIFNTADPASLPQGSALPGLYIRDLDPVSPPSSRNNDLLLERAPIEVVSAISIATDSGWQPMFSYSPEDAYFTQPFQTAYHAGVSAADAPLCGYWTSGLYTLGSGDRSALSYSIPLILDDGTVCGVLGVELLTDYLYTLLPYRELLETQQGAYLLAVEGEAENTVVPVLSNGNLFSRPLPAASLSLVPQSDACYTLENEGRDYFISAQSLSLYPSASPFSGQSWTLLGMVRSDQLFAFSKEITHLLATAAFLTLLAGVVCSILVSRRLARPISRLSQEIVRAQRRQNGVPTLPGTGITEIDQLSDAFTQMSREVVDVSTKFLRIMDMASIELGGYELRESTGSVYVTDNFFSLMGMDSVDTAALSAARFSELLDQRRRALQVTAFPDGSQLYTIPLPDGGVRYLRFESTREGERMVGLVEDVTAATLERLRIEYERDYDSLTGLYSRRAFYREAGKLFAHPDRLGHAALLMLDLDDLKGTNDRFGHDWGDQYIRKAAECFSASIPPGTLCARVSGDEFYILYHGFSDREGIRDAVQKLMETVHAASIPLPGGGALPVSASGGVAWYPEDSRQLNELMKYADFAMYQIKDVQKGGVAEFDQTLYNQDAYRLQSRRELKQLLEQELVSYHFQSIFHARTGEMPACEALMRVALPALNDPAAVLRLAKAEGCLHQVERLTMFKAAEAYQSLLDRGLVPPDMLLFVNSLASQRLTDEEFDDFHSRFRALLPHMVAEITEEESIDLEALESKRRALDFSGMFALDDYGSGYNSEKNLLELNPKFVKVDMAFIRGIDTSVDRRQLVASLVAYAHEREMYVVAEGIETASELLTVLELGVDLLQGFFLAQPAPAPEPISPAALEIIRTFARRS